MNSTMYYYACCRSLFSVDLYEWKAVIGDLGWLRETKSAIRNSPSPDKRTSTIILQKFPILGSKGQFFLWNPELIIIHLLHGSMMARKDSNPLSEVNTHSQFSRAMWGTNLQDLAPLTIPSRVKNNRHRKPGILTLESSCNSNNLSTSNNAWPSPIGYGVLGREWFLPSTLENTQSFQFVDS